MEDYTNNEREEIFSEKVKAGKRTYFFDVKSTRGNDFYVTITESKKKLNKDTEGFTYEKHKIFLYKEDFNKFLDALHNTVNYVKTELMPNVDFTSCDRQRDEKMEVGEKSTTDTKLRWD